MPKFPSLKMSERTFDRRVLPIGIALKQMNYIEYDRRCAPRHTRADTLSLGTCAASPRGITTPCLASLDQYNHGTLARTSR